MMAPKPIQRPVSYKRRKTFRRRDANARYQPLPPHLTPAPGEPPWEFLQRQLSELLVPRGTRHLDLWRWAEALTPGIKPTPRVEIWGRGGAKSAMAELICAYLACTLKRRFGLYVSSTQDKADLHVQAIAATLEAMGVKRAVNAYSSSVGWTATRIQTEHGFGVISVGLNGSIRGARLGEFRPDFIILDDIDEGEDSQTMTAKKMRLLSKAVLPAGSGDAAVLFIQNRIHPDGIIAQVADGRAEMLLGCQITEEPAVWGLEYERRIEDGKPRYVITGGTPSWSEGQPLAVCEAQINEWGLRAFLSEAQHEDEPDGGLWDRERDIDPYRVASPPSLRRIAIGIDPSGGTGTEAGIVAAGLGYDGHAYLLADDSNPGTTDEWVRAACDRYHYLEADCIVAEKNYGGDMVRYAIEAHDPSVTVKVVTATRGKLVRAEPIQQRYERGEVHHCGTFPDLEREMCRWQPGMSSPNRLDAGVWTLTELLLGGPSTDATPSVAVEPDYRQGRGGMPF